LIVIKYHSFAFLFCREVSMLGGETPPLSINLKAKLLGSN
jgi:hypothetical protein